ncbi:MAG: inositol monophosphatase family protein [Gammaproteobacteria bacterium]
MPESRHLSVALAAAKAAEEVILSYYKSSPDVQTKDDSSPVTIADIEAEQIIKKTILDAFPDHGFYGEETGRTGLQSEYLWLVDPIDGTKSFVSETPFFSTQIALMHNDELILGVSNAPVFAELACAERGSGSLLNGTAIEVSRVDRLADAALSTGNLATLAADSRWQTFGKLVADVNRVRGYGDFYHYHLLASGRVDVVIESDVNVLDIAALSVIVEEAGGRFTDLDGEPVGLATTSVLASNNLLYEQIRERL